MTNAYASIILTAHGGTSEQDILHCINALDAQTVPADTYEIILVIDKNPELAQMANRNFRDHDQLQILTRDIDNGLADARNYAASLANNDVLVFLDTDAYPDSGWLSHLLHTFKTTDCHVVGGPAYGDWPSESAPRRFPSDLNWLVGITHDGFSPETGTDPRDRDNPTIDTETDPFPVRNPFGCNLAVLRDTFELVGGFNTRFGKAEVPLQGEEVDLCLRISDRVGTDTPVMYHPKAIVQHDVSRSQLGIVTLFERAFWQGVTKSFIEEVAPQPDSTGTEQSYLSYLLTTAIPYHLKSTLTSPAGILRVFYILMVIGAVGLGYATETGRRKILS